MQIYPAEFMKDEVLLGSGVHSNVRQLPVDQLLV